MVVSESEDDVGLADTVESLGQFAGADIPVFALPRLQGTAEEKWLASTIARGPFAQMRLIELVARQNPGN